jgi:hypothetical protein
VVSVTKKVAVTVNSESIGLQIFDLYYAYRQSKDSLCYKSDIEFSIVDHPQQDSLNIFYAYLPTVDIDDVEKYDYIFIDNGGESLEVLNEITVNLLKKYQNVYLLCGAYLDNSNKFYNSVIPYNHNLSLFKDLIVRYFYPNYFEQQKNKTLSRQSNLCFIDGENRGWRYHFKSLLENANIDVTMLNNITKTPSKILDCLVESAADTEFREYINKSVVTVDNQHQNENQYYNNSVGIGIENKFGKIPPGYFILKEYYTYHCIIYPESSWINNELFVSEKTWKCIVSGSIPWIVSGARSNQIINDMGFFTAWNLLPVEYQEYDNELDHVQRHKKMITAIQWVSNHPEIWHSDNANKIRNTNFQNFFSISEFDLKTCYALDKIFRL